jgi:hypothetical protein
MSATALADRVSDFGDSPSPLAELGAADESHNGYLSSTDWSLFANIAGPLNAMALLGSTIKAEPVGLTMSRQTSTTSLSDAQARFVAVYVQKAITVTGIKWYQSTQGNYTADQNNYVALYSYASGTLTQVAISANNGNIWKATSNAYSSAAFAAPYSAARGIYFAALLYNQSAQVTAPILGAGIVGITNQVLGDFTNSAMLSGTLASQTSLPTSQAMSGLTASGTIPYLALY